MATHDSLKISEKMSPTDGQTMNQAATLHKGEILVEK